MITSLDNFAYQRQNELVNAQKIDELSEHARNTMQQLREIIWVMDKNEIELEDFKSRVVEYVSLMTKNTDIKYIVRFPESSIHIKPSVAIHLFRIIQEAVNNTLKHAQASELNITAEVRNTERLLLTIADNGKGFDRIENKKGHYGLKNIKQRCMEIQALCHIISGNKGTEIKITLTLN